MFAWALRLNFLLWHLIYPREVYIISLSGIMVSCLWIGCVWMSAILRTWPSKGQSTRSFVLMLAVLSTLCSKIKSAMKLSLCPLWWIWVKPFGHTELSSLFEVMVHSHLWPMQRKRSVICAYVVCFSMSGYGWQLAFLPASSSFSQPCWSPLTKATVHDPLSGRLKSSHHQVFDMYRSENPVDVTVVFPVEIRRWRGTRLVINKDQSANGRQPLPLPRWSRVTRTKVEHSHF